MTCFFSSIIKTMKTIKKVKTIIKCRSNKVLYLFGCVRLLGSEGRYDISGNKVRRIFTTRKLLDGKTSQIK